MSIGRGRTEKHEPGESESSAVTSKPVKLPRVISYGLVDARAAGGTLALVRLTTRGELVVENAVVGVYENILDAIDAMYNHLHARWYTRDPLEKGTA